MTFAITCNPSNKTSDVAIWFLVPNARSEIGASFEKFSLKIKKKKKKKKILSSFSYILYNYFPTLYRALHVAPHIHFESIHIRDLKITYL